ncbi:putative cytochrome P450 monooxygenase [Xylaria curta]|nr:putative cytochrome P450 monooxygenase [Xylaria curta]
MVLNLCTLLRPEWVSFFVAITIILLKKTIFIRFANYALSAIIHKLLTAAYPIYSHDSAKPIPTCPYKFPNGQGNVGKFLEGMDNSKDWKTQHGLVYRIWSGMRSEIVITRPEHVKAVFGDSDKHRKAASNNSGYLMSKLLGSCLGLKSGKEWKAIRNGIKGPFEQQNMSDHINLVQNHISSHFRKTLNDSLLCTGLLDPAEGLKMLPFWIVAEILYGELDEDMVSDLEDIVPLRESLFTQIINGGLTRFSLSRFLPTTANKGMAAFQARWRAFNDRAYERAKESGRLTKPVVRMYEDVHKGLVTFEQVLQTLDECLFANLDVTTGAISWNVIFLAADKHYQDRLGRELALHRTVEGRHQYILNNSTLLASCVSESARLRPAAAFSVPQSAPTTRIVDGYIIPAGTDIIIDAYSLNVRSDFWGPDADTYRPERFLEKSSIAQRYHYWRFGFGPRQCLGKFLADVVIRSIIIYLIENYELSLTNPLEEWKRRPEVWISHPQMQVGCLPKRSQTTEGR